MNKYAAEKIAQEYYNYGVQCALQALGHSKTARFKPFGLRNEVSTPLAALASMLAGGGAGGYAGIKALEATPVFSKGLKALDDTAITNLIKTIGNEAQYADANAIRDLASVGGSMSLMGAGALGALAGGNLALKGARKVLNKHNPIERYLDLGVAQIPLGKARI